MMSATAEAAASTGTATPSGASSRILPAFRLQFIVRSNFVVVPVMVFLLSWAVSAGITFWIAAIADGRAEGEPMYSGAAQSAVWTLGFMAAYTVTQTMPFAMALSFSRRTFVLGAYLAFAVVSAAFGVAFALGAWLERVTKGLGFRSYQFDLPFMTGSHGAAGAGLLAGTLCLAVMLVGFLAAAAFRRLSLIGFWTLLIAVIAGLAVVTLLVVQNVGGAAVARWFGAQTALTGSGYLTVIAVLAGALAYLVLRRDTPAS
ncbi:hypothetical protein G6030_05110 [Dietzia sp. E1]|uniref:hypothetical protein n=1 Tax=Dietzia sp. E1 TaxID=328361 RepID=UPI0015FE10F9|nr:hypothetical protein [Dietzia sp. E1]MBB1020669.1 hypothetical protein [Dietzia sp. E1]